MADRDASSTPRPGDLVAPGALAVRRALQALPGITPGALERVRADHPEVDPATVSAVATQVRLSARGRDRLGELAATWVLDDDALQQATRADVASYRAHRLARLLGGEEAGRGTVADLGCGLGTDSWALAQAGFDVIAVERDPWRAEAAALNLAPFAERIRVRCADAQDLDTGTWRECVAAYVDPARRRPDAPRAIDAGRPRAISRPDDWNPPWPWIVDLAGHLPVVAKASPGFDPRQAPPGSGIEWIDHDGSTVEACVWMGFAGEAGRRATVLGEHGAESLADDHAPPARATSHVDAWLLEPAACVRSARLVDPLAGLLQAPRVDGGSWLTAPHAAQTALARSWQVIAEVPRRPRDLRAWLRPRGSVTWKTLDADTSAADWDRRVGHRPARGGEAVTIVLTGSDRAFAVAPSPARPRPVAPSPAPGR